MIKDKKGIIFSDIDGTLCFHHKIHGIQELRRNRDGTVTVRDPISGNEHVTHDVSVGFYQVYLSIETRKLGHKLREIYDFVYVTGARLSTIHDRRDYLDFADIIILENGGMICDEELTPDTMWHERMKSDRAQLRKMRHLLRSQGWKLDDEGRSSAIRVKKDENPEKSQEEYDELCNSLQLPRGLKRTWNIGHLDIILEGAGKGNAVRFVMHNRGYSTAEAIAIGDDINDLDFLQLAGKKHVLASSYSRVLAVAEEKGWGVSNGMHFDGINEIFTRILADSV